jgi:hypothetical protein
MCIQKPCKLQQSIFWQLLHPVLELWFLACHALMIALQAELQLRRPFTLQELGHILLIAARASHIHTAFFGLPLWVMEVIMVKRFVTHYTDNNL